MLIKLGEFRREDRSRWMTDRRDQYAKVIDELTEMTNAAQIAEAYAYVGEQFSDSSPLRDDLLRQARQVQEGFYAATGPFSVLRLLAPKPVWTEADRLLSASADLMRVYLSVVVRDGVAESIDAWEPARLALVEHIEVFTEAARKDIRA